MRTTLALIAVLATTPAFAQQESAQDIPQLDLLESSGINQTYDGPWEFFVGGGTSAFDCNGDRKPDVVIAGGTNTTKLFVNNTATGKALKFTELALPLKDTELKSVSGIYALDIDNDGHKDLVLLRVGENILLKGGENCSFTKANDTFNFDGGNEWTTAFAARYEQGNNFPTLAFGNYVDRDAPDSPWGTCHDNYLFRPAQSDQPDYGNPTTLTPGYCALSMIFTDWNKSGTPSLRISNDRQYYRGGEEQLWHVDPDEPPRLYTREDGWQHLTIWGMGIAQADLDADGFPEYALTSMGDTKVQTLDEDADDGTPVYRDIAVERGMTAHRPYTGDDLKPSTGWHSEFADFNNDGWLDLFIAKGNVEQMPDFTTFDPDNLLLGQYDGTFIEAGEQAGLAQRTRGRGAAIADLNMDGTLDLIVVNRAAPATIFQNRGGITKGEPREMGNWLQIELQQDGPNRDAIGALVSVKSGNNTRTRTITVGGGHASGSFSFAHIGLGPAERASIRIKWPDGSWSKTYRAFANNFVVIKKGDADVRYWYPE